MDQLLEAYPRLTREGVQAALQFAREALRADVVYPISESAGWKYSPTKAEKNDRWYFGKLLKQANHLTPNEQTIACQSLDRKGETS